MAARRAHAQHARSVLRFLPLLSLLAASLACGLGGLRGARSLPVTHRPASELRLAIQITGQYSDRPDVVVLVHVFAGTSPNDEVALAGGAHLTCNGQNIKASFPVYQLLGQSCTRQPPGGAYRITYTDEHGVAATLVVPIPAGSFAILSPRAGSMVPIPTDGPLTIRYSTPTPPTNGSVAIDGVSASCGTSRNVCGTVYASLRQNATPTASRGAESSTATTLADWGLPLAASASRGSATPAPGATPTPLPGGGQPTATIPAPGATPAPEATSTPPPGGGQATATLTQSGNTGTITLKGDFAGFQPGPGGIDLWVEGYVAPDRGGFAAATVNFVAETISVPITWTR